MKFSCIINLKKGLKNLLAFCLFLVILFQLSSCKKYLDEKPLQSQYVPSKIEDLQALLDNIGNMNGHSQPLLDVVADDYYIPGPYWQVIVTFGGAYTDESLNYIWDPNAIEKTGYKSAYAEAIYNSNVVLDLLPSMKGDNDKRNALKGSALFYRAFAFNEVAQLYCRPYSSSASTDLGIILRLNSNITEPSERSTVQQTYDQIIGDLKSAADLLPSEAIYPSRPSKASAYGELARVYLSMRDYVNAGHYADLSLQINNSLLDYNTIAYSNKPFQHFNVETIFYNYGYSNLMGFGPGVILVDSTLFNSYDNNDLRKTLYYVDNGDGTHSFNGNYAESFSITFTGITTDEMYLIRAESFARAGNKDAALSDLNALMIERWNNSAWTPITATDVSDVLKKILSERRKELVMRGLRWSDLRRFNLENANITLKREIDPATTYILPPNDLRWVLLFPSEVIKLSDVQQNPR